MKIALVYDRATKIGGAERVLSAIHEIWPDAPLYTAFHYPQGAPWTADLKVNSSFLQYLPFANRKHELFPWATPIAFETFDFSRFDVVLSVTSAEAKAILTKPSTLHICYCLTPTRYLWSHRDDYIAALSGIAKTKIFRTMIDKLTDALRALDLLAAQRPDVYISISNHIRQRLKKYYQRESFEIIYPPIDAKFFIPQKRKSVSGDYFLLVSRTVSYKRIDIVVEAFNELGYPLIIIGSGEALVKLRKMANANITFIHRNLTDRELARYYQNCRAFVFAGNEDFGLVAAEAQACGKPVIAYRKSGISEIITDETGILYNDQSVKGLEKAVVQFQKKAFSPQMCRRNAKRFDKEHFKNKMKKTVETLYHKYKNS